MRVALSEPTEAEVKRSCVAWLTLNNLHPIRVQSGQVHGAHKGKHWVVQCAPAGTADVLVILPPRGYALWIEFKGRDGKQSPEQVQFAERCAALGAGYRLVRNLDQLIAAVREEQETARA